MSPAPKSSTAKTGSAGCAYHELAKGSRSGAAARRLRDSLENHGLGGTVRKVGEKLHVVEPLPPLESDVALWKVRRDDEVLGLRAGELVEVKSADEIRETLDSRGMNRGLFFMLEMWNFPGRRFRVLKRMDRLMVEATGTMRSIKNTVLLEGTTCDGTAHEGCEASCHHMWREVWLRRVPDGDVAKSSAE